MSSEPPTLCYHNSARIAELLLHTALRAEMASLNKAKPQRSYLRVKIDKAAEEVQRLSEQLAALESDKKQLQAQADTQSAGLALADFELQSAIAGQLSLGAQARGLQHKQLRLQYSMAALPPTEEWDLGIRSHISGMSREQLRYLLLTGYKAYSQWLSEPGAFQDPATVQDMKVCASKMKQVRYCFSKNPATWATIVNCNLETGEGSVAFNPNDKALAALPYNSLPPGFLEYLEEGLALYHNRMHKLERHRRQLGQRVSAVLHLLPESTQRLYSCNGSYQQLQHLTAEGAGESLQDDWHVTLEPGSKAAPHPANSDVVCCLDKDLQEIEETFMKEFRVQKELLEYVLQKLPLHFLVCHAVACQPYHTYLPTVFAALLRVHGSRKQQCAPLHQRVVIVPAARPVTGIGKRKAAMAKAVQQQALPVQQRVVIVPARPQLKGMLRQVVATPTHSPDVGVSSCSNRGGVDSGVGNTPAWFTHGQHSALQQLQLGLHHEPLPTCHHANAAAIQARQTIFASLQPQLAADAAAHVSQAVCSAPGLQTAETAPPHTFAGSRPNSSTMSDLQLMWLDEEGTTAGTGMSARLPRLPGTACWDAGLYV